MLPKRALYFDSRAFHFGKRALYFEKRALYFDKRALHPTNRALCSLYLLILVRPATASSMSHVAIVGATPIYFVKRTLLAVAI